MSRWQRNVLLLGASGAVLFGVASTLFPAPRPEVVGPAVALAFGLAAGTLCGLSRIVAAVVGFFAFATLGLGACITVAEEINDGRLLAPPAALFVVAIVGVVLGVDPAKPRRGSVLASAERRDLSTRVVVGTLAIGGMTALFGDRFWAAAILAVATLVLAILIAIEVGVLQRIGSWLSSAEPATNPERGDGETIDLGVGQEIRRLGPEARHPYRGAPPGKVRPLWLLGDPAAALRDLQSRTTMRALAMAVGAVVLGTTLAAPGAPLAPKVAHATPQLRPSLPVWDSRQKPVLLDVNGDGTEDVIGIRRLDPDSADVARGSYFLVAVSGETFETLWATEPTPKKPGSLVACGGQVFTLSNDGAVAIIDPTSGTRRALPSEVLDLPGSPSCPLGDFCVEGDTRSCTPSPSALAFPAEATFGRAPLLRRHGDDAVALGSGRPEVAVGDSVDDYLMGFDPATLEIRWKESVAGPAASGGAPPHHHDVAFGRVLSHIQGSDEQVVTARDARTARELWTRRIPNAGRGSELNGFVASPTRIYVLGQARVEVLVASSGEWIGTVK